MISFGEEKRESTKGDCSLYRLFILIEIVGRLDETVRQSHGCLVGRLVHVL